MQVTQIQFQETKEFSELISYMETLKSKPNIIITEVKSETGDSSEYFYGFKIEYPEIGIWYRFLLYAESFKFIKMQQSTRSITLTHEDIDLSFIKSTLKQIHAKTYKSKATTIDFDGCYSTNSERNKLVYDFTKKRLFEGHDCFILTYRFDELNKHRYPLSPTNDDLWEMTSSLFMKHHVIFMNTTLKGKYLAHCLHVVEHIDDSTEELDSIRRYAPHVKRLRFFNNEITRYEGQQ